MERLLTSLYNRPGLLLTFTALFWAGNLIIGRAIVGVVPPVTLATLRWSIAFLILLPFAWPYLRREATLIKRHMPILLFLGLVGPGCYNTLSYIGLVSTEAVNGFMLGAAGPIFIALAAWAIFGDRVDARQWLGLLSGFAGVVIIISRGDVTSLLAFKLNFGDIVLVIALITWAIYTAFLRKRPTISWQSFCAVTFGVAAIGNVPLAAVELASGYDLQMSWSSAGAILYVSIFPSIVAYIFFNRGIELLGPARAAPYLFLVTIFGTILATLFLNEKLYAFHAVGFLLIAGGVVLGAKTEKLKTNTL